MKKTYFPLLALAFFSGSIQAIEFKASGGIEFFTKVGFNHSTINVKENIYPTDTWGSMIGTAQVDVDFLTDEQKEKGQSLTGSIGALAGGILFDQTRKWGDKDFDILYNEPNNRGFASGDSLVAAEYITANFVIYNAYLNYQIKKADKKGDAEHIFSIKAGRYRSTAQFHSGFTQGFELDYKYKGLELWWFSSYGRAFAFSEWIYDFYSPKKYNNVYYGVHAFKPSYSFDNGLYVSPFVYFSPDFYIAPMLELGFDSNPSFKQKGFRSKTKVIIMSPFHTKGAAQDYRYQFLAGKGGQTLSIQQQFDINNFYFGAGWYQNFGNANAHIGTYGNAAIGPWDFWTNTVYDFGALTNAITKDAKTGYIYLGAKYKKISWDILGRMTFSPRADEQAVPLNIYYSINDHFDIWLKLEWQNVTLHKGFVIYDATGYNPNSPSNNPDYIPEDYISKKDISQDRSHIFLNVAYKF